MRTAILRTVFLSLALSTGIQALPLELPENFWEVQPGGYSTNLALLASIVTALPEPATRGDYYRHLVQESWEGTYLVTIHGEVEGKVSLWLDAFTSFGGTVEYNNERLRYATGISSPFQMDNWNGPARCDGPACRIDFLYNVPQLVTFRTWAVVDYEYDRQGGPDARFGEGPLYVQALGGFSGAWEPTDQKDWVPSRHTSITAIPVAVSSVPEPATAVVTAAGLLVLAGVLRRRR